jgi:hypothetical protein
MKHDGTGHLGIVELHSVATRLADQHDELFRTLGAWAPTTTDPAAQQLFAEAGHRHAWHADLWRQRIPAIPVADIATSEVATLVDPDTGERAAAYADAVSLVEAMTRAIDGRIDPVLDPATRRVAELTLADLDALGRRVASIG